MESADIGYIGERHVVDHLIRHGYRIHHDTKGPGATDIVAYGDTDTLVIQVKTAIHPSTPDEASQLECSKLGLRAAMMKAKAVIAQVTIDSRGGLIKVVLRDA